MKDWLQNLNVGDTVIVEPGAIGVIAYITKVARFTKTLLVTKSNARFNRVTGHARGGGYHNPYLREATSEALEQIKQKILARKLVHIRWDKFPLSTLETISSILAQSA